jgi:hypothetical protein
MSNLPPSQSYRRSMPWVIGVLVVAALLLLGWIFHIPW